MNPCSAEVYPALWSHSVPRAGRGSGQKDAYATAEWLRLADIGALQGFPGRLDNFIAGGSLQRVFRKPMD